MWVGPKYLQSNQTNLVPKNVFFFLSKYSRFSSMESKQKSNFLCIYLDNFPRLDRGLKIASCKLGNNIKGSAFFILEVKWLI
jgi:hypothetical protein